MSVQHNIPKIPSIMTRGKRKNGEKYTITEKSIDVVKFY